jgi:UDP-N-acetylglucosamine diphosphorylase/glucosamine-1-phosphate N-acetyltransferase
VNNSVILGYSNKGHDGFLGNSVLGEWCNLGADTNNSNLKTTYGEVSVYGYAEDGAVPTGLQFCGLIMGDHSKSGINTMFNTGTVVGVCANIFGGDFPPKHIPGFSWGGATGFDTYELDKALVICKRVMERRHVPFTSMDEDILREVCHREEEQAG